MGYVNSKKQLKNKAATLLFTKVFDGQLHKERRSIMSLQTGPYALHKERRRLHTLGALVSVLASTEQTGGTFNMFDAICPIGYSTPLHIHYAYDVAVFVLEGTLVFFWGDEKMEAHAGAYFFQPRGVPHGFRVTGTTPARILYSTLPGGFDEFVIKRSEPITDLKSMISEAHFKIEIVGSLSD